MTPDIPVAILAGGLGTRLHPLTEQVPKALVNMNGEPFVAHQLRLLRANGISRVIFCLSHLGEMVQDFVGSGKQFNLSVDYSFDGPQLLGTAGAIRRALPLLGEAFFVLYGDSYLPCSYQQIAVAFHECGKLALMTVFRNNDRWDASNVEFENGRIVAYNKRNRTARMCHIDYGLGVFQRAAFAVLPDGGPVDLAILHNELLQRDELAAFEVSERFFEIGSLEGLRQTTEYLRSRNLD